MRPTMKFIAATLAILLAYDSVAIPLSYSAMSSPVATPAAQNPWAIETGLAHKPVRASANSKFSVPASLGYVTESSNAAISGRRIYHFQDVHNDVAAQANLSEMMLLLEKYARRQDKKVVVAVEGSAGPIDSDTVSAIPNQAAKERVGSALLRAGYLLGEEYAAILQAPGRIKIIGVETPSLYSTNASAKKDSAAARERVLLTVREVRSQLQKLMRHNFTPLLVKLEENRIAVENGTIGLSDHLNFLSNIKSIDAAVYPHAAKMMALSRLENTIDFEEVEAEGKRLVSDVMAGKTDDEIEAMVVQAKALKEGRISALSYYSALLSKTTASFPLIDRYVSYLRQSDAIDTDALFDEVQRYEIAVGKTLVRHPVAGELYEYLTWIDRQEKFFSLNLIPQEWHAQRGVATTEVYKRHATIRAFVKEQTDATGYRFSNPSFNYVDLTAAVNGARTFYEMAEARDKSMVENLLSVLKNHDAATYEVAFIAGGFHTPGVIRQLKNRNVAYEVIRPQLEAGVALNDQIKFPSRVNYMRQPGLLDEAGAPAVKEAIEQAKVPQIEAPSTRVPGPISRFWSWVFGRGRGGSNDGIGLALLLVGGVIFTVFAWPILAIASIGRGPSDETNSASAETTTPISDDQLKGFSDTEKALVRSGDLISRFSKQGLLSNEKIAEVTTIAAALDLKIIYVADPNENEIPKAVGKNLFVPERYIRNDNNRQLTASLKVIEGYEAAKERLDSYKADLEKAKQSGLQPSDYHFLVVDQFNANRFQEKINSVAFMDRFQKSYPKILKEEMGDRFREESEFKTVDSYHAYLKREVQPLFYRWFLQSNIERELPVESRSTRDLERANKATQNLQKVIEIVSAIPASFDPSKARTQEPESISNLKQKDENYSEAAIQASQAERDRRIYLGVFSHRYFAGGSWVRGGLNVPAALVAPADLAKTIDFDLSKDDFQKELVFLARYLIQVRAEVIAIAERNNWPVEPGLALQEFTFSLSASNAAKIERYFADADFFGYPESVFKFTRQRTGRGYGLTYENEVRVSEVQGPRQDTVYGHLEAELSYSFPNEAYTIDKNGDRQYYGAPLYRQIASQQRTILHHQISLLHALREGWVFRADRMHNIFREVVNGKTEAVFEFHKNTTGAKGGLSFVAKGLSDELKEYFRIPLNDDSERVVFIETLQTLFPGGSIITDALAGLTVNSAVVAYNPAALENRVRPDSFPGTFTMRAMETKRAGADGKDVGYKYGGRIFPDGVSYLVFNVLNAKRIIPSDNEGSDKLSNDNLRFENKTQAEFPQAIKAAIVQDNSPANTIYRAEADKVVATLERNRAERASKSALGAPFLLMFGGTSLEKMVREIATGTFDFKYLLAAIVVGFAIVGVIGVVNAAFGSNGQPSNNSDRSYSDKTTVALAAQVGENSKELLAGVDGVLADKQNATPRASPANVAIDADSLHLDVDDIQGYFKIIDTLAERASQVASELRPDSSPILYTSSTDEEYLEKLGTLATSLTRELKGVQFRVQRMNGPVTNAKQVFAAAGVPESNLNPTNTYVLTWSDAKYDDAQVVSVSGVAHAAVATFAYSYYPEGKTVFDRLVELFAKFDVPMSGNITAGVMAQILARIAA